MKQDDKIVVVVVDNVHSERTSAIFHVMDIMITSFNYIENAIFLLVATFQSTTHLLRIDRIMSWKVDQTIPLY